MDNRWIWNAQLGCMVRHCAHIVNVRTWGAREYCSQIASREGLCAQHQPRLTDLEIDYAAERGLLPDGG